MKICTLFCIIFQFYIGASIEIRPKHQRNFFKFWLLSIFLQHKQNNALHKAVNAMNSKANIQHNKVMKLDDTMLMCRIYNAETLEKLIKDVHDIHNITTSHEKLFAGEHNHSVFRILYTHSLGLQQYSTNSLLYLRIIQDKYISLYRELIA